MRFNIAKSCSLIGKTRLLLSFSACMYTVLRCTSMSTHLRRWASPIRAAVSFKNCKKVAVFGLPACISASNSCSVGM